MKKIAVILLAGCMLLLTGCEQVADLVRPHEEEAETVDSIELDGAEEEKKQEEQKKEEEPKTKIVLSQTLNMTNEWTLMGDYKMSLTRKGEQDRVLLGTSAKSVNGEMQWDDSQYWTLAVLTEKGAYNLFFERFQGLAYAEVNEAYIRGVATPVITLYVFSGAYIDIRNYIYDAKEDAFIEEQMFSTKAFSTGGINNLYSTFPEYKAR